MNITIALMLLPKTVSIVLNIQLNELLIRVNTVPTILRLMLLMSVNDVLIILKLMNRVGDELITHANTVLTMLRL